MGGVASTTVENESQLVSATGGARSEFLKKLAEEHKQEDQRDFYELFGLPRYSEIAGEVHTKLKVEFRSLMRRWHPDKNASSDKDLCDVSAARISLAKRVLEDPDLKRRYDIELRAQLGEEDGWSTYRWWIRWGYCVAASAAGIGLVAACAAGAPWTAGMSLPVGVVGSALLTSGIQGSIKMLKDPNCSNEEFAKDISVGAAMGAAGGAIAAAAAPAIAACSTAAGQVFMAAGIGAGATASAQIVSDAVDVVVTEGMAGERARKTITDCKTIDEVFSSKNAQQLVRVAAVGAVAGGGAQLASALAGSAANAGTVVDDVATGVTRAKDLVKGLAMDCPRGTGNMCMSLCASRIHIENLPPLHERIRKLAPDAVHRLVEDARVAHFMLSRTNLQKDFADSKVAQMLRDGFALCADNSLKGGWGGRGWVERYVSDAKKTKFGVLVLEGGEDFFESGPCCDELYAAQEAGINLTKVHGQSILSGEYLWVKISKDVFASSEEYELKMRTQHGEQYTPHFHTATLRSYYKSDLKGVRFTYYCIVPRGHGANATGAAMQRF